MTDAELDALIEDCNDPSRGYGAAAKAAIAIATLREQVAAQSAAADMIAEERDAWEKRAKIEATLRLQCANDSQMHLDRALAAEADNAALRAENARLLQEVLSPGTIPFNWQKIEADNAALRAKRIALRRALRQLNKAHAMLWKVVNLQVERIIAMREGKP